MIPAGPDGRAIPDDPDGLGAARTVADAVLYEGYLLYPYRSTSSKNQLRWQFGVLGPPGASAAGLGEAPDLQTQCLLVPGLQPSVRVFLRFLHLQRREVQKRSEDGSFVPVSELSIGDQSWIVWDEAVAEELHLGPFEIAAASSRSLDVEVGSSHEIELLPGSSGDIEGQLVRTREPLDARLTVSAIQDGDLLRLTVTVENVSPAAGSAPDALSRSLIGTHLLIVADGARFLSLTDPPPAAAEAARRCMQRRGWPVLTGVPGGDHVVLASPIILYDHPEVAAQSAGDLFDSTEIDEILTLRVLTMTDGEKAQARATDARAAALIDRCEQLQPEQLQRLHGVLRDPHAGTSMLTGDDWWAAEAAAEVTPELDSVNVAGVQVGKGSRVRLHPTRRADAHDIFYADQEARVTAVNVDLDGITHVAVTLLDDPAAEFHDWYGRYLYFAPDELEPLDRQGASGHRQPEEKSS